MKISDFDSVQKLVNALEDVRDQIENASEEDFVKNRLLPLGISHEAGDLIQHIILVDLNTIKTEILTRLSHLGVALEEDDFEEEPDFGEIIAVAGKIISFANARA